MDFKLPEILQDRRVVIAGGVAVALFLGLVLALSSVSRNKGPVKPPPASQGGLVVEMGPEDDARTIDPTRELRCFVNGQFVGMSSLADCAKRNGVATGALDVGIDVTGELAATQDAGTVLTPLPPPVEAVQAPPPPAVVNPYVPAPAPQAVRGPVAACWRYADRNWSRLSDMSLSACVQTLYAGRCERPGGAMYGRWGEQTLRLVPGEVEIAPENGQFRSLVKQGSNCSVPAL